MQTAHAQSRALYSDIKQDKGTKGAEFNKRNTIRWKKEEKMRKLQNSFHLVSSFYFISFQSHSFWIKSSRERESHRFPPHDAVLPLTTERKSTNEQTACFFTKDTIHEKLLDNISLEFLCTKIF